jgi:serine/threonine protein kinase
MKADLPSKPNDPSSAPSNEETVAPAPSSGPAMQFPQTVGSNETPSVVGRLPLQLPASFGRYELTRLLGHGGMGAVYLARDTQLDRSVALKVPFFTAEDGPHVLERFFREARAAATLHHANICPIFDVGEINGIHFLTMAYIDGRSLAEVLRRGKQPISPRQAVTLVRRVALALAEAHRRQIVHRDLKPGNIMLTRDGTPIITDFGLARRCDTKDVRLTQSGTIVGTPAYMAPEQAKGKFEEMGPSCDIYSLGVILYEVLTRRLPFYGEPLELLAKLLTDEPEPPSQRCPAIDAALDAICLKALAKKPADRYATMTDFAAALGDYLKNSDQTQALEKPPAPPDPLSRWRRPLVIVPAAVLALILLASILAFALYDKPKDEATTPDNSPSTAPEAAKAALPDDEKDEPVEYIWPAQALRDGKIRAPDLSSVKPLLHDTFKNPKSGFVVSKGPQGARGYRDGKYFIQLNSAGVQSWRIPVTKKTAEAVKEGFVCRIEGYSLEKQGRWGVRVAALESENQLQHLMISLFANNGLLQILPVPPEVAKLAEPALLQHSAIKKGEKVSNSLLLVFHGRQLEVYVNDVAVCDPRLLARPVSPQRLALAGGINSNEGGTVEFTSVTIWPLDKLPSLRKRGAMPRP